MCSPSAVRQYRRQVRGARACMGKEELPRWASARERMPRRWPGVGAPITALTARIRWNRPTVLFTKSSYLPGDVPNGTCTFSSTFAATNSTAGPGTLSPGSATFEVDLVVDGAVVAQKTVPVALQSGATITALGLSLTSNIVLLEGASVAYAATLQNVDVSLSGVSLQGFVRQGGARRFAGAASVSCGSGSAVLPKGTCTVSSQLTATNNSGGKGTLMSGDATFELQLMDGNGALLSIATIPVSIVEGPLGSGPPSAGASADRLPGAEGSLSASRPIVRDRCTDCPQRGTPATPASTLLRHATAIAQTMQPYME